MSLYTSRERLCGSITKTNALLLFREMVTVYSEIHTKSINTFCGQDIEIINVKASLRIATSLL
jgi:hypothetical protein